MPAVRLVIATGGKSIPKMGATGFGYDVARQFGLDGRARRPGSRAAHFRRRVAARFQRAGGSFRRRRRPLRQGAVRPRRCCSPIAGSVGPAILQISSYWREGEEIGIDLAPGTDVFAYLKQARSERAKQSVATVLASLLPKRLADHILASLSDAPLGPDGRIADIPDRRLAAIAAAVNDWRVVPSGTEGFRTAEVTLGGVDTGALSSKTFEARDVPGLYFIGEVVDVTGHLGGFNFQWAWSSGYAAGQYV